MGVFDCNIIITQQAHDTVNSWLTRIDKMIQPALAEFKRQNDLKEQELQLLGALKDMPRPKAKEGWFWRR